MSSSFLAFDFETANMAADSACSIGLVRVQNRKIIKKEAFLIRPPTKIFQFTHIHQLTWNDVKDAPTFGELWPTLKPYFEEIEFAAAHNASFDNRVLTAVCSKYSIKPPKFDLLCTVQLARKTWGIHPTKLPDVCKALKIELNHHEALSDALACAKIVIAAKNS